jgi:hypothetical protein
MRLRNLERYKTGGAGNKMQLGIPLPRTPSGRVYRFSPNKDAHPRHFLLGDRAEEFALPDAMTSRMKHMPGTPGTVCPYSGVCDDDDAFTHPDDRLAAQQVVAHAFRSDVADAFHGMFEKLARNHSSKFLKITTSRASRPQPRPRFARRDLLRDLVCDECGRGYGVFAISLYCPDCGAPNIHLHFAREAALVRHQVELGAQVDETQRELAYRLLGNAHEDVLTAFETTLKTVYLHKVRQRDAAKPVKPVGNAFQNIERGRRLFAEFDFDPFAVLTEDALAALTLNIQKRHVIGHNLGVADAAFAEHAADARVGETIPLMGEDILQFAGLCQLVVNHIDAWLAEGVAPPQTDAEVPIPVIEQSQGSGLKIGELGSLAIRIGFWISEESAQGFDDHITEEDLRKAFPDESVEDLALAVAELATDGYVSTTHFMSTRIPHVRTTTELYLTFDPHTLKHDPAEDVVKLIDLALAGDDAGAQDLHASTGWPLRRFNPAFAYMLSYIDEGRVASGVPEYPAHSFFLMDEDRVELKRLADRLRR